MTLNIASFGRNRLNVPATQGIKYAELKLKIFPYILGMLSQLSIKSVLDGFSGSTRVAQAFAKSGIQHHCQRYFGVVRNTRKSLSPQPAKPQHYLPIIEHLNGLKGEYGWFPKHYGGMLDSSQKRPFQPRALRCLLPHLENRHTHSESKLVKAVEIDYKKCYGTNALDKRMD